MQTTFQKMTDRERNELMFNIGHHILYHQEFYDSLKEILKEVTVKHGEPQSLGTPLSILETWFMQ